jgi:pyrroloquinoline quinone biosynthesis protein D
MVAGVPSFARGVRLRREADGSMLLLVPEGVVRLNATAAAALDLVDGKRTQGEIVAELEARGFDATAACIAEDVGALFERLRARHFLR